MVEELQRLTELHRQGALTDAEFAAAKARLLNGSSAAANWTAPVGSRLRRLRDAGWVGGVCAGLASATGSEAWLWRLGFVVLAMFGGSGFLAYALLWIFVPPEPTP